MKLYSSQLLKTELFARQKQLIRELSSIFVIKRMELLTNTTTSSSSSTSSSNLTAHRQSLTPASMATTALVQKFKILNACIRMWPSASSNTINSSSNYDRENAVAIGHIAQALQMLAMILAVPLRYPIVCRASKSFIVEQVAGGPSGMACSPAGSMILDREPRMLALYRQTSAPEEFFFYAVNLLNADLVQLRVLFDAAAHRNVDHSDPLVNLKWIFDFFNK